VSPCLRAFQSIIRVAQPLSAQTGRGLHLDGVLLGLLRGLEKIAQPGNFNNLSR
jgi:hypothetical protein